MGVRIDMFVAPASGHHLSFEQFKALLVELVAEQIVSMPFVIIQGDFDIQDRSSPLGLTSTALFERKKGKIVRYAGDSKTGLQHVLQDLPFGQVDLAIWFEGLNWNNSQLREEFEQLGCYDGAEVVIYALKKPSEVMVYDAYRGPRSYQLMHYFTTTEKSGPDTIQGTTLGAMLADHLGPDLIVDCSCR